ncbi:hypothetical protein L484_022071 [Morus notabilis]|uniref:Uncharacterized protein n=1 Tax=Morus notabilis TaxID=981085 RepID=W9RP95_9ROSA|nr:hypothetical protein L484_022071 [Morus notabilis]
MGNDHALEITGIVTIKLKMYDGIVRTIQKDELEITSRLLGRKEGYSGTTVLMKNKATGEIIAEGRHSLFGKHVSKL